jgi:hypothetical protein
MTDAQLIEHYQKLRAKLAVLKEEFTKTCEPYETSVNTLETELARRLIERGAQNTKTEFGTAYFAHGIRAKVVDRDVFLKFCVTNWDKGGAEMIDVRALRDPVKDFMSSSGQNAPPGVEVETYTNLNVRRT